jgi:hypothetical protein
MRKFLNTAFILIIIGTVVYVILPLFVVLKTDPSQSMTVGNTASRSAFVEAVKETVQKIEYALDPQSQCLAPFHYAIGTIDPRFNINRETLKADMQKAEALWEGAAKQDVLQYDDQSDFKVNLVFDERQQRTIESKKLAQKLDSVQELQEGLSGEYDTLSDQYDKKKSKYESDVKQYKKLSDEYERQVTYWNAQGGAPEKEYQQLQQQQKTLNALADTLEAQQKSLNALVEKINGVAAKERKVVSSYNENVATYESVYGGEKDFDQGVYTGQEINIYQFEGTDDLALVLAHEFGHALGMGHVENPKSIMYYLMSKQDINHPVPSAEDMQALQSRCLQ